MQQEKPMLQKIVGQARPLAVTAQSRCLNNLLVDKTHDALLKTDHYHINENGDKITPEVELKNLVRKHGYDLILLNQFKKKYLAL